MKKFLPFIVFLVLTLTVAKAANAATTLFLGGNIGGGEMITDRTIPAIYNGNISNSVVNLTYIKNIEFVLEYQNGRTNYYWPLPAEYGNIRIGYPIVDEKAGLIFLTVGYQYYKRDQLTEVRGFMVGMDLIVVATDNFYAGLDFQVSPMGATYRRIYPYHLDLPMDQLTVKIKAQFILTDHIGLMANLQWFHFDANNGLIQEHILTSSAGLVFRL